MSCLHLVACVLCSGVMLGRWCKSCNLNIVLIINTLLILYSRVPQVQKAPKEIPEMLVILGLEVYLELLVQMEDQANA